MLQARQDGQVSLARARDELDTALHAAELQLLKAQDEAQQAHATAQSIASSVEQWKSRSGWGSPTPRHSFTPLQALALHCNWHGLQIQAAGALIAALSFQSLHWHAPLHVSIYLGCILCRMRMVFLIQM